MDIVKMLYHRIFGDVSAATVARTVCFFLALANQILSVTGHTVLPISDEQVEALVTVGFTVITGVIAWWKNNSFTQEAIRADRLLESLKSANR